MFSPVRCMICIVILTIMVIAPAAADNRATFLSRRQRAAAAFHDGILLLHAFSRIDVAADGYRQDPYFYYLTGLENTVGAILAIEGKSGQSWLFLPSEPPFANRGLKPQVSPGPETAKQLGIDHVVDWSELEGFVAARATSRLPIYYVNDVSGFEEMPANLVNSKNPKAPLWVQVILDKWPSFEARESSNALNAVMNVQSAEELTVLRLAARATVIAFMAGMRAIHPGVSQRSVESTVDSACWGAHAHGVSFWPWAMTGENAVFPKPFTSLALYDHLNANMQTGDLVRLDVGCEWEHYIGDLGRTVPVSGHYSDDQRETWNLFVAAYRKAAATLREGTNSDKLYAVWRAELLSRRTEVKTPLAQHAIDSWSKRENVPFWQVHTTNLLAWWPPDPFLAGMTANFEPIASVDGQGFFLEDMYVITKDGAEILTPGVPYTAEEIEAGMRR